jgi:hypothetical protein
MVDEKGVQIQTRAQKLTSQTTSEPTLGRSIELPRANPFVQEPSQVKNQVRASRVVISMQKLRSHDRLTSRRQPRSNTDQSTRVVASIISDVHIGRCMV